MTGLCGIGNRFRVVEAQAAERRNIDERFFLAGRKLPRSDAPGARVNNTAVTTNIFQPLGPAVLGEIGGRAADRQALHSNRARHQAGAITNVAPTDCEIEAVLYQVHWPVVEGKLQL